MKISSKQVRMATGQRRETVERRSRSSRLRNINRTMPIIMDTHWVVKLPGA